MRTRSVDSVSWWIGLKGTLRRRDRVSEVGGERNSVLSERRRRLTVAGIATAGLLVFLAIRALDRDHPYDPCPAPTAAPPAETALLPSGLSFADIGTVTRVRKDKRNIMVRAVTTKPLDEVTVLIQDAVVAAGYRPAGMDNEGFEAEVFFTTGSYAGGLARVRRCRSRWDIDLVLLDRNAAPPRTTVTPTTP